MPTGSPQSAGRGGFISSFCLFLVGWAVLNTIVLGAGAFDPFPFIFLNLMLSMLAALQAPIIMMSQNRQAAKDRLDYETNLRAEARINRLLEEVAAVRAEPVHGTSVRQVSRDRRDIHPSRMSQSRLHGKDDAVMSRIRVAGPECRVGPRHPVPGPDRPSSA